MMLCNVLVVRSYKYRVFRKMTYLKFLLVLRSGTTLSLTDYDKKKFMVNGKHYCSLGQKTNMLKSQTLRAATESHWPVFISGDRATDVTTNVVIFVVRRKIRQKREQKLSVFDWNFPDGSTK